MFGDKAIRDHCQTTFVCIELPWIGVYVYIVTVCIQRCCLRGFNKLSDLFHIWSHKCSPKVVPFLLQIMSHMHILSMCVCVIFLYHYKLISFNLYWGGVLYEKQVYPSLNWSDWYDVNINWI